MKNILPIVLILMYSFSFSQESNKVLIENLQGTYTGEEKKGLAHGEGEARGIDHYKGEFKRGLPHGEGTYTWKDGRQYTGNWKKGQQHGYGEFKLKIEGHDTVFKGYFYENDFLGDRKRPEPKYKITESINISRYTVTKTNSANNQLVIYFESQGRDPYDIVCDASSGTYSLEGSRRIVYTNVAYPFNMVLHYSIDNMTLTRKQDCRFKLEINEGGSWEVKIWN